MLLFNKLAHNMQVRPWSLVSIPALLYDNKLVVFASNYYFYVQSWNLWQVRWYDHVMIATPEE